MADVGAGGEPIVIGFETSCDETGVGLVRGSTLLADALATSVDEHERFGGVVPEIASRAHLEAMVPTVHKALADAGLRADDVDAVAVTSGPGLTGALLVGVAAAKAYALALDKPLYGVNHLAAHVAVDELQHGPLAEPSIALLVSGGHSSLLLDALLAEADKRSPVVLLEVRADNDVAQRLYQRRGFTEIGRRRGYYQPSGADAVVMRRKRVRALGGRRA